MTVSIQTFRQDFPAFMDPDIFPDPQVAYWLKVAGIRLDPGRWSTWLDIGTENFMAHMIALEVRAMQESTNGSIPGTVTGPINSKSVDKVSVGFNTSDVTDPKAGHWNQTIWGLRYWEMLKMLGAGAIQVGAGWDCSNDLSSMYAYGGPWYQIPNPA